MYQYPLSTVLVGREGREKRQLKYRITAKAAIRARISVMNSKEHFRFKKIILRWTISDYTNALHYDLRTEHDCQMPRNTCKAENFATSKIDNKWS